MTEVSAFTNDGFLDRRLTISQPKRGFRAGHDSVLLAASVPARPGEEILELGSGVGVVSLCVAARVPDVTIVGIEIDPELVRTANANAQENHFTERVHFLSGDVLTHDFAGRTFDHVFLNPPFHPESARVSPDEGRARAMHDEGETLDEWTLRALRLVRPSGSVTVILRADRLDAWHSGIECGLTALPLLPREGEMPKRVIARLSPGTDRSFRVAKPFVLHRADGRPTEEAEAVLRHAAALSVD